MSTAHEIATYLSGLGHGSLGGQSDWGIFVGMEPDKPVNCITIYDTGGLDSDTDEMDIERPTFQVRIRCKSYLAGATKHRDIKAALLIGPMNAPSGRMYYGFGVTTDIASLGTTDRDKHVLVASYRTIVEI